MKPRASPKIVVNRIISYYARPTSANMGGVNKAGQEWMLHLAEAGFNVTIVHANGGYDRQLVSHPRIQFTPLKHFGKGRMTMIPRGLKYLIASGDLVYLQEGWTPSNLFVAWHCLRRDIPYVVMPHGVYETQWVSSLKPFPFRHRFEKWLLEHARSVHLFFEGETTSLRLLAPRAIEVVALTGAEPSNQSWKAESAEDYFSWLGRYSIQHKGIDLLFEAIASIPPGIRPRLEMRGQDYFGGKAETIRLRDEFNLQQWVNVGPELSREEVDSFLLRSKAFIHVPRWESVGLTLFESLGLGVPVIVGDGAQISKELSQSGGALIVSSTDPALIAEAIMKLTINSVSGQKGKKWLMEKANWQTNTSALIDQLNISPNQMD